jgi:hypothetical protein
VKSREALIAPYRFAAGRYRTALKLVYGWHPLLEASKRLKGEK